LVTVRVGGPFACREAAADIDTTPYVVAAAKAVWVCVQVQNGSGFDHTAH